MGLFDKIDGYAEKKHVRSNLVYGSINNNRKPKISILMPIYNHPQYFEQALLSALIQDCDFEYEIIVCDNNHPEYQLQNQEIINKFKCDRLFYYVNEINIGGLSNWNRCIELATADDVTFCHDDDKLLPDTLRNLALYREKIVNKKSLLIGHIQSIDENNHKTSVLTPGESCSDIHEMSLMDYFYSNYTNGCGALFSRECLLQLGGFDERYIPCPDYSLNVLYSFNYGSYMIKPTTLLYRISSASDSATSFTHIPLANKRIRDEIISKMHYPNVILRIFSKCLYDVNTSFGNVFWQKKSMTLYEKSKYIIQRIVIKLSKMLLNYRPL